MQQTKRSSLLPFAFFNLLCLGLFFSTIDRPFLSDDYDVLYRVALQKQLLIPGFFRPLSDLTIYGCYLVGGLNAAVFNVFNLLVHGSTAFLLYRFCRTADFFPEEKKPFLSWAAGLLFLIYPFHLEPVLWMVGRASGISNLFAVLALLLAFANLRPGWKYGGVSLCYFLGLASYETLFPLPLILLIFLYKPQQPLRSYLPWIGWLGLTLVLHLLLRNWAAQSLAGSYGERVFSPGVSTVVSNFFKVTGRLLLPPSSQSQWLALLYGGVLLLLAGLSFYLLRRQKKAIPGFFKLLAATVVACLLPALFGVNTHTTEGDRLLYFASFFFVLWLVYFFSLFGSLWRYGSLLLVTAYFLLFLFQYNGHWNKAGDTVRQVLQEVKQQRREYRSFGIVNLPEEHKGAFIFRVGFPQALLIHGIDTSGIMVLRKLASGEVAAGKIIQPEKTDAGVFIAPNTLLSPMKTAIVVQPIIGDTVRHHTGQLQQVFFWDTKRFRPVYGE